MVEHGLSDWEAHTDCGTVRVRAGTEAQARSRAKWKAVHARWTFRSRAEELAAVRDCAIHEIRQLKGEG